MSTMTERRPKSSTRHRQLEAAVSEDEGDNGIYFKVTPNSRGCQTAKQNGNTRPQASFRSTCSSRSNLELFDAACARSTVPNQTGP